MEADTYRQCVCAKGHYFTSSLPAFRGEDDVCPICKGEAIWTNDVISERGIIIKEELPTFEDDSYEFEYSGRKYRAPTPEEDARLKRYSYKNGEYVCR